MSAPQNPLAGLPGALGRLGILIQRELGTYFVSVGTYVILTMVYLLQIFLLYIFSLQVQGDVRSAMGLYFGRDITFYLIMLFLPPVITMRLFSEEKKKGTLEMLMSAPVTDLEVVLAKYLSSCVVMAVVWLPSVFFMWYLARPAEGNADWGPMWASLVGVAFLSAFFLSIGLFTSALADEQVVAAVFAMILETGYLLLSLLRWFFPDPSQAHSLQLYNPYDQFARDLSVGVVDSRHVALYGILTLFFLFGTYKMFEGRRWK